MTDTNIKAKRPPFFVSVFDNTGTNGPFKSISMSKIYRKDGESNFQRMSILPRQIPDMIAVLQEVDAKLKTEANGTLQKPEAT